MKLAVIGSGVAGLSAAFRLKNDFDITIFEKDDYIGGHTNTIDVKEKSGQILPVDTGFIVHNEKTYPGLLSLFRTLGVETAESDMSFSHWNQESGLQFSGKTWGTLFAQKANLLNPSFYRLLFQANRFNTTAPGDFIHPDAGMSLRTYLNARGYSKYFIYNYIVPMGSAVWSTPIEDMLDFPAYTLIKFFENHGFLGMNTGLKWRYVRGGSRSYVNCLRKEFPEGAFQAGEKVLAVRSSSSGVEVITPSGIKKFDRVIIASHADQALSMLESPDEVQCNLLSAFRYVKNMAVLHTDEKVMPPIRNVWSSWNYKTKLNGDTLRSSTVYYMNRLQKLNSDVNYFVSINDFDAIHPDRIIKSIEYEHPLFDTRAVQAQDSLYRLNLNGPVFFAGAYFKYGFHEDGYQAGVQAAEALLGSVK